ncbi:hypothetical protein EDC04DRAFT_2678785 [Pisolithus marmoratus]|nr:hypothetical protein EDC04DRAFT_2678785 [Pisolithus marmoratus]
MRHTRSRRNYQLVMMLLLTPSRSLYLKIVHWYGIAVLVELCIVFPSGFAYVVKYTLCHYVPSTYFMHFLGCHTCMSPSLP